MRTVCAQGQARRRHCYKQRTGWRRCYLGRPQKSTRTRAHPARARGCVQPRAGAVHANLSPHRAPHTPATKPYCSSVTEQATSSEYPPHDKRARERLRPSQRWPMECELESIGMAQRNPAHRKKCMGSDSCRHPQTSRGVVVGTSPDRSQACLRVEFPRAIPMDSRPHFVAARAATPHGARAVRERDGARWRAVGSPQQLRPLERGEVLQAPGCACASILFHCFHRACPQPSALSPQPSPPPPRLFLCEL